MAGGVGGLIARVLSFVNTSKNGEKFQLVKSDPGGGDLFNGKTFQDGGEDSPPLPTDLCFASESQKTGNEATLGFYDPKNQQKSAGGEKRTYGRSASGAQVCEIWQKNDGTIIATNTVGTSVIYPNGQIEHFNGSGHIKLLASGNVDINGVIIDIDGNITLPEDQHVTVSGVGDYRSDFANFGEHVHEQDADSDGDAEQDTDGPKNP